MYKFQQLAQTLKQLIENGTWPAQSKLPSLRSQAQSSGLSLMTVLSAYQELEAQGLVYAKDKSGFYVAQTQPSISPSNAPPILLKPQVQINSLVFRYLKALQSLAHSSFGSAFPEASLLSNAKLNQRIAWHAKHHAEYQQQHMPPGNLELRKLIAARYQLQGIPATAEDIVITSGALEALNLSLQALTQAGDYILLQQTIFYGAWQAAERLGLKVISIAEHPQHGIDLQALAAALARYPIKVCWLMLNSHNPIGFSVSPQIKVQIADLLRQHQVHLIEDDSYQELYFDGPKPRAMNYYLPQPQVFHCASFSKTLGPSLRIGWVYAGQFSQKIQHLQLMSTLSVNPLLQQALVDFVGSHHYDKHLKRLRLKLQQHKQQHYQLLKARLPQTEIVYANSGYFLWIKLPPPLDALQVFEQLLAQQIAVAPSALFCLNTAAPQAIRLNCSAAVTAHSLAAIELLAKLIASNPFICTD
jgi:DNA-binding transcriptional MocR family regulator